MSYPLEARRTVPTTPPWFSVAAVAAGTFVMVTSEFLPIGLLSAMAHDLSVSTGSIGLLVTVPGVVAAVAAPVGAVLMHDVDRRQILVGLSFLILLSNTFIVFADRFELILASRVLLGLSVGGFWTFAAASARRMVTPAEGNRATAVILTGISAGTVFGVPIGTAMGALGGWRTAFAGVACLSLIVLLAQFKFLPSLRGGSPATWGGLARLLQVPRAAIGFAAAALASGGHFVAYTYLEPLLTGRAGLSSVGLSWTLAAYGLSGLLGTLLGERAGSRDIQATFLTVTLLMAVTMAIAALLNAFVVWTIVSVAMWGACFGAFTVSVQIWTFEAAPDKFEPGSGSWLR